MTYNILMREFEWDENKNIKNIEKHFIDFNDAIFVFNDSKRIDYSVVKNGEKRIVLIGLMGHIVITIIYTIRGKIFRIISARRSKRNERERYQTNIRE